MMNISPMVNSVKCTFFACIVHFLHVLEGSTAYCYLNTTFIAYILYAYYMIYSIQYCNMYVVVYQRSTTLQKWIVLCACVCFEERGSSL